MLRALELLLACRLILIFSPLLIGIAFVILLSSGRPIFYMSPRIGKDAQPYDLFYFRTQVVGIVPR